MDFQQIDRFLRLYRMRLQSANTLVGTTDQITPIDIEGLEFAILNLQRLAKGWSVADVQREIDETLQAAVNCSDKTAVGASLWAKKVIRDLVQTDETIPSA